MRSFGALVIVLSLATVEGKADGPAADFIHQARAFREKGDYSRAEQVLREGIEATGKTSTEDHRLAELPFLLNTLGDLLREENRGAEARTLFERALGSREASWQQRFSALMGIADIERMARSWPESIGHWNEAAELARQHGDPTVEAFALRGLGDTWLDQADTARAEPLLKRALSVLERSPSVTPERLAIAIDSLAALYRAENKLQLAEELWMRELTIDRTVVGENHPQTAIVKGRLADALSVMGDYESAKNYAAEAVDSMKSHFGDDSMATGSALVNAGFVEERANHIEAASRMYEKAYRILRAGGADAEFLSFIAARRYSFVLTRLHRGREAKEIAAQAKALKVAAAFHDK